MKRNKLAYRMKWGVTILMGLPVAIWLLFGIGEMASGDLSGAGHLVPAALMIGLLFLAWKRPLVGGIILVVIGSVASAYFFAIVRGTEGRLAAFLLMGAPFLVSGVLFMVVAWLSKGQRI